MGWKDHVPEEERGGLMVEYDDGSAVLLSSYTGGGHPSGVWGRLRLMRVEADGRTTFREFLAKADWSEGSDGEPSTELLRMPEGDDGVVDAISLQDSLNADLRKMMRYPPMMRRASGPVVEGLPELTCWLRKSLGDHFGHADRKAPPFLIPSTFSPAAPVVSTIQKTNTKQNQT